MKDPSQTIDPAAHGRRGQRALLSAPVFALSLALSLAGCRAVPFYERERLNDRVMTFGTHALGEEMRGHVLSPREAAVGGFSSVGAGGCGCH